MSSLLNKIDRTPIEIVMIIKKYIPREIIIITNKKDYENEYMNLRLTCNGEGIPFRSISYKKNFTFQTYIKKIIANNMNYIFEMLIKHKYNHWINIKKYRYRGYKYSNYIQYLEQLCIQMESTLCKNVICDFEKNKGIIRKKRDKKIRRINNTWSN